MSNNTTSETSGTLSIALALVCVLLLLVIIPAQYLLFSAPPAPKSAIMLRIEPGMTTRQIALELERQGVIRNARVFTLLARLSGSDDQFQPGIFTIDKSYPVFAVMKLLQRPGGEGGEIRFIEGWTMRDYAGEATKIGIDSVEFLRACSDKSILAEFGISAENAEGYLFPDTYKMLEGTTAQEAVRRLLKRFREVLPESLAVNAEKFHLTEHQMVTLASIIEAEVQKHEEAPLVSAVYHNRLRKGIILQADPTIQYVLPDGPRRLLLRDLQIESPYNTYKYKGLPPGPICNPGKHAIRAAFAPAQVNYLFFVSQADGTHAFNETISGHLKSKTVLDSARAVVQIKKKIERDSLRRIQAASKKVGSSGR